MKRVINPESIGVLLKDDKNSNGAPITVQSNKTGVDYTFILSKKKFKSNSYLHVSVETNYLDFKYLGYYRNGRIFRKDGEVVSPSAIAIGWVLRNIESNNTDKVRDGVQIMHTGKCIKCGRTLTDAESIEIGLGPVCRG